MDLKPKVGEAQRMIFGSNVPPPFYDWAAPPQDKKAMNRGKLEKKEGYDRKAKGMKQLLWERAWCIAGMSATAKDPKKNIGLVLGSLPDFKNERSSLQHPVEK